MNYDLRDMQYFIHIVDESSFTKAAEKLFISQPALSRKLHELEERVGVKLLNRTTRCLSPTAAGTAFYHHAKQMLNDCEQLNEKLEAIRLGAQGLLRLGYGSNGQFDFAMRITSAMQQDFPEIVVRTEVGDMLEALYTRQVDAALLQPCEVNGHEWLNCLPLETAGLSLFFSADDPLASESGEISLSQLSGRRFVLPQRRNVSEIIRCTTLFDQIRSFLINQGIDDHRIDIAKGTQAFTICVAAGRALGIMPDSSRVITNELVQCRPIKECREGYEVLLAWRRKDAPNQALQALYQTAKALPH